jgi:hypothetical protein
MYQACFCVSVYRYVLEYRYLQAKAATGIPHIDTRDLEH